MPTSNKEAQPFESTLERDLMYLLKFDSTVDRFVSQPVKIKYVDQANLDHSYTPDILIYHRKDTKEGRRKKNILAEVKYRDDLCKNFREYHPKFRAAMKYAKSKGWIFKVYTEENIRTPYLENAKFLTPYINYEIDQNILMEVMKRMTDLGESTPQALVASFFSDKWNQAGLLPVLWHLVARKHIGANLLLPLTMTSCIWCLYDI